MKIPISVAEATQVFAESRMGKSIQKCKNNYKYVLFQVFATFVLSSSFHLFLSVGQ